MAWAPRTWAVGEIVTATQMNTEIRDQFNQRALRQVVQAADITITSDASLRDTDMSFTAGANEVYAYWAYIAYSATTASDFRWAFTIPSGAVMHRSIAGFDPSVAAGTVGTGGDVLLRRPSSGTNVVIGGKDTSSPPADHRAAFDMGTLTMGATAGTVIVRVGQGTSSTDQTILRSLSTLMYQRIA